MAKIILLSMIAVLCKLTWAGGFITGYKIDSSGDFGRDCKLYSGSVTSKYTFKLGG